MRTMYILVTGSNSPDTEKQCCLWMVDTRAAYLLDGPSFDMQRGLDEGWVEVAPPGRAEALREVGWVPAVFDSVRDAVAEANSQLVPVVAVVRYVSPQAAVAMVSHLTDHVT